MLMTFKSIPLTSKSRENFLIQKQYEDSAQAAYARARNALMVAIAIHARYAMGEALLLRSAPPEFRNAKQHKSHRHHDPQPNTRSA
jgi:hypothetical protein